MAYDPITGLERPGPRGWSPAFGDTATLPGHMPDYKNLIANDPGLKQLTVDLSAQGVSDRAGRAAARRRGYIEFGQDFTPDANFAGGDFAADIDASTRALAQTNTAEGLSTTARIDRQHSDNVRALKNALAERGLLRSGATGHQLGREDLAYKQAQHDARQKVLDYFAGVEAAFVQAERQRQGQRVAGLNDATSRVMNNPAYQPTPSRPLYPSAVPGIFFEENGQQVGAQGGQLDPAMFNNLGVSFTGTAPTAPASRPRGATYNPEWR